MLAAQPRPVREVAEDRDGNIVWQKRFRPEALHVDAPAARAAGWGPGGCHTTIFSVSSPLPCQVYPLAVQLTVS